MGRPQLWSIYIYSTVDAMIHVSKYNLAMASTLNARFQRHGLIAVAHLIKNAR
jgi:hypothetical protein